MLSRFCNSKSRPVDDELDEGFKHGQFENPIRKRNESDLERELVRALTLHLTAQSSIWIIKNEGRA